MPVPCESEAAEPSVPGSWALMQPPRLKLLAFSRSGIVRPLGYRTMRLTKQTSYALRILIHCALSGGKHVKAADIAAEHGITEFNVAKIVPILVRGGFITTSRGRTGGLKLARRPEEIGIGDVIRVTEATHVEAECVGGTTLPCGIKRAAPINRMLGEAVGAFIEV